MVQKRGVKLFFWALNLIVILLLIWSLVNYRVLNNEVGELILSGGLVVLMLIVILLEGAPVFIGPGMGVASILAMGVFNPWLLLFLFLVSALIGNIAYYFLGYFLGRKLLSYFDKKDVIEYKKAFKKYGKTAMLILAISPTPHLPSLAGIFKVTSPLFISQVLFFRFARHLVVFSFLYYVLI